MHYSVYLSSARIICYPTRFFFSPQNWNNFACKVAGQQEGWVCKVLEEKLYEVYIVFSRFPIVLWRWQSRANAVHSVLLKTLFWNCYLPRMLPSLWALIQLLLFQQSSLKKLTRHITPGSHGCCHHTRVPPREPLQTTFLVGKSTSASLAASEKVCVRGRNTLHLCEFIMR